MEAKWWTLLTICTSMLLLQTGCAKEEEEQEDEDIGVPLPDGTDSCVTSEAEPRSSEGFIKWQVAGDYSGDLEYKCYVIPTLTDGDTDPTNGIHPDAGLVFNDNNEAGAYTDTVHISFSFFSGLFEGLETFRFCPYTNDATHGLAGSVIKIRTPKLEDPIQKPVTYDVWMHVRCDDEAEHLLVVDSHDQGTKEVTGHFDNIPYRTDETGEDERRVTVSATFKFTYQ
jgi:hypothetical protein